jgi:hypothetical protein
MTPRQELAAQVGQRMLADINVWPGLDEYLRMLTEAPEHYFKEMALSALDYLEQAGKLRK